MTTLNMSAINITAMHSIMPGNYIKQDLKNMMTTLFKNMSAINITIVHNIIDTCINQHLEGYHIHFDVMWKLTFPVLMEYLPFAKVANAHPFYIDVIHEYMESYCMRLRFRSQYGPDNYTECEMYHYDNVKLADVINHVEEGGNIDETISTFGEPLINMLCVQVFMIPRFIIRYSNSTTLVPSDMDSEIERLNTIINYLVNIGCNFNIPNSKGIIPIMYTTVQAVFNLVNDTNINTIDNAGKSVMKYAQDDNNVEFIQMMHQRGYVAE